MDHVIKALKENGFTEYEAKIYISLLKEHPANGNMISVSSGVPGPKVYETLRGMERKQFVYLVTGGDKSRSKRYKPMPYPDLLDKLSQNFNNNHNLLSNELESINTTGNYDWLELFHIEGYSSSLHTIIEEITKSQKSILLSCWNNELIQLKDYLIDAFDNNICINTITFDKPDFETPWNNTVHLSNELFTSRHLGELNLVIDSKKSIVFENNTDNSHAVVSSHHSVVNSIKNYIRHDIYLNKVLSESYDSLTDKYGENLKRLFNIDQ